MKIFGFQIAEPAAFEATLASVGSKSTYGGAAGSGVSWFLSSEFGIVVGILIGVAGFTVNWYYSRKRDAREQEEHDVRMARIKRGANE